MNLLNKLFSKKETETPITVLHSFAPEPSERKLLYKDIINCFQDAELFDVTIVQKHGHALFVQTPDFKITLERDDIDSLSGLRIPSHLVITLFDREDPKVSINVIDERISFSDWPIYWKEKGAWIPAISNFIFELETVVEAAKREETAKKAALLEAQEIEKNKLLKKIDENFARY